MHRPPFVLGQGFSARRGVWLLMILMGLPLLLSPVSAGAEAFPSTAAEQPASMPWWDAYPRITESSNLNEVTSHNSSVAFDGSANDPYYLDICPSSAWNSKNCKGRWTMGLRNAKKEVLERLESKTLDARFEEIVQQGLGCSPFEAQAVIEAVKEVYFPFFNEASPQAPPGKVTLLALGAEEPAGKSIKQCQKVTVCLTLHRGAEDDRLLLGQGPQGFRRARIAELCQEALSQGGLLTREDLALRIFFVDVRTISRDLAFLRQSQPEQPIPLRGTVQDIGPVLTHRTRIVRLALEGKTTTQICAIMHHSPAAVANYLATFTRCAQLAERQMQAGQIAFLLRRGRGLIEQYLALLEECRGERNMQYHLEELLRLGQGGEKKTSRQGGRSHGR